MNEYRIALAGNPNTGKTTLFNALTGMHQHTGNWPGKTVARATGSYEFNQNTYQIVDLPGTYSLYANSVDEEVARDYILFENPDVTIVIVDATSMERNMNLALQVLELTDRVVIAVNLMDEAARKGIQIDAEALRNLLGVPVIKISARDRTNFNSLLNAVEAIAVKREKTTPYQIKYADEIEKKIAELEPEVRASLGNRFPARWIALRLIDGDTNFIKSLENYLTSETNQSRLDGVREGKNHGISC